MKDDITEAIEYVMDNNLANCEDCGEFHKEDDLYEGMCEECVPEWRREELGLD